MDFASASFQTNNGLVWEGNGLLLRDAAGTVSQVSFTVLGTNNTRCQIESNKDLRNPSGWQAGSMVILTNGSYRFTEAVPAGRVGQFYRAVLLP